VGVVAAGQANAVNAAGGQRNPFTGPENIQQGPMSAKDSRRGSGMDMWTSR